MASENSDKKSELKALTKGIVDTALKNSQSESDAKNEPISNLNGEDLKLFSFKNTEALLIIAFISHILFFLLNRIGNQDYANYINPYSISNTWTFYWVWLVLALILSSKRIIKLNVNFGILITSGFVIVCLSMLLGSLLLFVIPKLPLNYVGIRISEGVDYTHRSEEIEKIGYKYLLDVGEIETKQYFDSKINSRSKRDKFYKYLDTESFHFWQTGVAKGYRYKTHNNLTERLELWFTVGPVLLMDILLSSFKTFLVLFILNTLWYRKNRTHYLFQS